MDDTALCMEIIEGQEHHADRNLQYRERYKIVCIPTLVQLKRFPQRLKDKACMLGCCADLEGIQQLSDKLPVLMLVGLLGYVCEDAPFIMGEVSVRGPVCRANLDGDVTLCQPAPPR